MFHCICKSFLVIFMLQVQNSYWQSFEIPHGNTKLEGKALHEFL